MILFQLVCFISATTALQSVPPLIEYTNEFEGKQCLRVKMRLALSLSGSEFLLNNENVGGNCSEVTLGWPSAPFPEIGRLILKFNLDTDSDGLEHAGLRYIEVTLENQIYSSAINDRLLGAPIGQSYLCKTGFEYRLCPASKPLCSLNSEAALLRFSDVRFQPFQIESKMGFDPATYCLGDVKLIFPVVIAATGIILAILTGLVVYQTKTKRLVEEQTFHEL